MHKITKFYTLLFLAVIIAGGSFAWQFFKARQITVRPNTTPLISDGYYEIPTNEDNILGNPGAPLTLILFSDFVCADCQQKYSLLTEFVKNHPQAARLFIKYSPEPSLFFKPNNLAYRGALCANQQNKFWDYNDMLIQIKNPNNQNELVRKIKDLKINIAIWQNCLNDQTTEQKTAAAVALSQTLGITKVPTIYVNNKRLNLDSDPNLTDLLSKLVAN